MVYSLILAPVTAPFALIPIIPNIPFFYVAFRAWSHWRALEGSKHLQKLLADDSFHPQVYKPLDEIYDGAGQLMPEKMRTIISESLKMPDMVIDIERAHEQMRKREQSAAET